MLLALLYSFAWAADCDGSPVPPSTMKAEVDAAMMAFSALDEDGFLESYDKAQALLSCVDSAIDARDAAGFHRLEGIKRFLDGNDAGAQRAFETSLALEPGYTLPASIAPPGGPLAKLFTAATTSSGVGTARLATDKGTVLVDGLPKTTVSDERPAVVQIAKSRAIVWSGYWGPEGLPGWIEVEWNADEEESEPAVVDLGDSGSRSSSSRTDTSRTSTTRSDTTRSDTSRSGSTSRTDDSRSDRASTSRTSDSRSSSSRTSDSRSSSSRSDSDRARDERARDNLRLDPPKKQPTGPRPVVGVAAIGTGVVAAALYGAAIGGRLAYNNDPTDGKRALTNGTYFGSVGLGLIAGGLGVAYLAMPTE